MRTRLFGKIAAAVVAAVFVGTAGAGAASAGDGGYWSFTCFAKKDGTVDRPCVSKKLAKCAREEGFASQSKLNGTVIVTCFFTTPE